MRGKPRRHALRAAVLGGALVLAGCGSNHEDLKQFVARVASRHGEPIKPVPEIPHYSPYSYHAAGRRSPFAPPTATSPSSHNGVHPNLNRPLDPLEHFPLDSLHMLGTITSGGVTYALIKAPDGVVHRIAPGQHMGRHYGRVDRITPSGLTLTEIVPNGNGGFVKHGASLTVPQ